MLVLTRKKYEGIIIESKFRIVLLEIRGDKVRLGIKAPRDVAVHRDEVWVSINGPIPEELRIEGEDDE